MAIFRSEILCFIFNKYGKVPANNVKKVLLDFYSEDAIAEAKQVLHAEVSKLCKVDRCITRKGDNRGVKDIDDIYALLDKVDEEGLLDQLPTFAAVDLCNVPSVKPEELDVCLLTKKMNDLEALVVNHTKVIQVQLDDLKAERRIKMIAGNSCVADMFRFPAPVRTCDEATRLNAVDVDEAASKSSLQQDWAGMANQLSNDDFTVVMKTRKPKINTPASRRIVGTKSQDTGNVTGVPRRIAAFVGRLNIDTTVEDMEGLMSSAGIKDIKCNKLTSKEGKVFSTAAFFVSCPAGYKDAFYSEATWPLGCELRDWVFKTKPAA